MLKYTGKNGYHVLPPTDFWKELKSAEEWVDNDFDEALAKSERIIVYFHGNVVELVHMAVELIF